MGEVTQDASWGDASATRPGMRAGPRLPRVATGPKGILYARGDQRPSPGRIGLASPSFRGTFETEGWAMVDGERT
jgi:hypothetical protein